MPVEGDATPEPVEGDMPVEGDATPEPIEGDMPVERDGTPEPVEGELVPAMGEQIAELPKLPVPATSRSPQVDRRITVSVPATALAATGGFLLGVATFVLVRLLRRPDAGRRLAHRRSRLGARRHGVQVESTRSFLVDVHVLKR